MDRRVIIQPRWLTLPLVVLGFALLPGRHLGAAGLSIPAEEPSVRIAFLGPEQTVRGRPGGRLSEESPHRKPRVKRGAVTDRIALVFEPVCVLREASSDNLPVTLAIRLHESSSFQAASWPSTAMPPEARATSEPRADQEPAEPVSPAPASASIEPADVVAEPPTGPFARPAPAKPPETARRQVVVADPHPLPEQTPAATAEIPQPFRHPVAGYLLLPPEATARRSEQLEYIARQADRQIRRGFELAGRKAHFTARSQFIRALRLLAQGLDAEHRTDVHSRSLAVGLTAMKEAEDFIPTASGLEADLDVPAIVDRHRTPVLKDSDTEHLTPLLALTCYFTFAQEQLAAGAGNEVAGSMALHALGKLYGVLAQHNSGDVRAGEAKAVAFYQAALLTYPRNYMAANDLGVLLARCGNCRDAEAAMKYSLSLNRQPTGWHNLAVVYRQLGQAALARRAEQLSEAARRDEAAHRKALGNASHQRVRWMDPASFLQLRANTPAVPLPKFTGAKPAKAEEPNRSARGTRRSVLGWLPWRVHEERK